ncbi:hypothetical protein PIB30_064630 [Stylosanthes scabra]|uniref:Uncharacterized protein n=1 Tax=Stylosanthes scabra TaxID=79078 RepID=A0ABU6VLY4_9FABA|nr:hypothetical protein [Stylosanthes scabra]
MATALVTPATAGGSEGRNEDGGGVVGDDVKHIASAVELTMDDGGSSLELQWNGGDGEGASSSGSLRAARNGGDEVVGGLEGLRATRE